MRLPSFEQLNRLCDEIADTLDRLRRNGPDLIRRASRPVRDSFPTRTLGSDGWGGGGGDPVSDPVGNAVAAVVDDPVRKLVEKMVSSLTEARDILRLADRARGDAAEAAWPSPPEPASDAPTVAGCVVHARYDMYETVRAMGRCRWCNDFRAANDGRDATKQEIRDLEDKRVAQKLIRKQSALRPAA